MKRKKQNINSGFSVIELLIVFVVIGLIGGGGYYVFQRSQSSNQLADKTASAEGPYGIDSGTPGLKISYGAADKPTAAQERAIKKKCSDEQRKGNDNGVLTGTKACLAKFYNSFYKVNKYKYKTVMTDAGVTIKACRTSNNPEKPVKVKTFPDYRAATKFIKEQEQKYGAPAYDRNGRRDTKSAIKHHWEDRYSQTVIATLKFDEGKFRPVRNNSGNTWIASKEMYYISPGQYTHKGRNLVMESDVSIYTAQFSGYYGQYNGKNKNPKAFFSIYGEDLWANNTTVNSTKTVRFLSLPKC